MEKPSTERSRDRCAKLKLNPELTVAVRKVDRIRKKFSQECEVLTPAQKAKVRRRQKELSATPRTPINDNDDEASTSTGGYGSK